MKFSGQVRTIVCIVCTKIRNFDFRVTVAEGAWQDSQTNLIWAIYKPTYQVWFL